VGKDGFIGGAKDYNFHGDKQVRNFDR